MKEERITEPRLIDRIVTHQLRAVGDNRRIGFEGYLSNQKWSLASLLAINGGGLLASLNFPSHSISIVSAGAFYLGIMSAIFLGIFGQRQIRRSLSHLQEYENYLLNGQEKGVLNPPEGDAIIEKLSKEGKRITYLLNFIALIAFTVGVATAGLSKIQSSAPVQKPKMASQ